MSKPDEPRIWAKQDRTKAPPQRQLARDMRAAPTEAERKLWGTCATDFPRRALISVAKFVSGDTSPISLVTRNASSWRSMEASMH